MRHNQRFFIDALGEDIRGELLLADVNHVARESARFTCAFICTPIFVPQDSGGTCFAAGALGAWLSVPHGGAMRALNCALKKAFIWDATASPNAAELAICGVLGHTDTLIRALAMPESQKPRMSPIWTQFHAVIVKRNDMSDIKPNLADFGLR